MKAFIYVDVQVRSGTTAEILFRTLVKCIANPPTFLHVVLTLKLSHERLFLLMLCMVASVQTVPVFCFLMTCRWCVPFAKRAFLVTAVAC